MEIENSLITPPSPEEKAGNENKPPEPKDDKGGAGNENSNNDNLNNLDPFDDANDYKDDKGLYLGKYKTVQEAFKGYKELSAKLREKAPEVPKSIDEYEFSFKDESLKDFKLTKDDPLWSDMAPSFVKGNIPKESAQIVVEDFILRNQRREKALIEAEKKAMGDDFEPTINSVRTFLQERKDEGMDALAILAGRNHKALKAFRELIEGSSEQPIPSNLAGEEARTKQEWMDEAAKYKQENAKTIDSTPAQQKHYYALMAKAAKATK